MRRSATVTAIAALAAAASLFAGPAAHARPIFAEVQTDLDVTTPGVQTALGVDVGATVIVDLLGVDFGFEGIDAFFVDVGFDPAILDFVSGAPQQTPDFSLIVENSPGVVRVSGEKTLGFLDGPVATLTFTALAPGASVVGPTDGGFNTFQTSELSFASLDTGTVSVSDAAIPLPGALPLALGGVAALGALARRRRARARG